MTELRMKGKLDSLVRWQFERGAHHITCGIDMASSGTQYSVLTVPHWDVNSAIVETFDASIDALQHHATIATQLRDAGWIVASYSD
jgi:hypothetical protein